MLRIRRLTQLLVALCASAFLSTLVSLVIYRTLSLITVPRVGAEVVAKIGAIRDVDTLSKVCTAFVGAAVELKAGGVFLASWGLGHMLLWSLILGVVAYLLYRQLSNAARTDIVEQENFIDRALAGKLELWKVFWGLYGALSLSLLFLASGVLQLIVKASADDAYRLASVIGVPMAISLPATVYFISALLVWRSAKNASHMAWGLLAKAVVIVVTVLPIIQSVVAAVALFSS